MISVVTDSTAYLRGLNPPVEGDVRIVPLQVTIDRETFPDSGETMAALRERASVITSQPGPSRFAEAYAQAEADGAEAVVSIHLSGEISGTVESARIAAFEASLPVDVVDSRSIGMGLGFPVLAAVAAARRGVSAPEVTAAATACAEQVRAFFYVDTLEYLRRGGRIGAAASMLGSALMIKPLLSISDGKIVPLEKVRTAARALSRLEELVAKAAGHEVVDVAVQHVAQAVRAKDLADRLRARLPRAREVYVGEVGAVIGAHVGPGALGVFVAPAP